MSSPSPARPGQDRAALVGKGGTKYSPAVTDTLTFSPASPGPKGRRGDAKITPDPGMGPQSPGAVAVVVSKGEPKSPATDDMDDDGAGGKRSAAVNPNVRHGGAVVPSVFPQRAGVGWTPHFCSVVPCCGVEMRVCASSLPVGNLGIRAQQRNAKGPSPTHALADVFS
jgi:hypothetical protein